MEKLPSYLPERLKRIVQQPQHRLFNHKAILSDIDNSSADDKVKLLKLEEYLKTMEQWRDDAHRIAMERFLAGSTDKMSVAVLDQQYMDLIVEVKKAISDKEEMIKTAKNGGLNPAKHTRISRITAQLQTFGSFLLMGGTGFKEARQKLKKTTAQDRIPGSDPSTAYSCSALVAEYRIINKPKILINKATPKKLEELAKKVFPDAKNIESYFSEQLEDIIKDAPKIRANLPLPQIQYLISQLFKMEWLFSASNDVNVSIETYFLDKDGKAITATQIGKHSGRIGVKPRKKIDKLILGIDKM